VLLYQLPIVISFGSIPEKAQAYEATFWGKIVYARMDPKCTQMDKQKEKQDQVDVHSISRYDACSNMDDGPYIVDPPGKISDTSKQILEEVKIRRAEALRLLADH
jgi:hypothetical protein